MPDRTNIVYRYDGSYAGLLCCIFESFKEKEDPVTIELADEAQETMFAVKYIETDAEHAKRVDKSIPLKISAEAHTLVKDTFLSCLEEKELRILEFLRLGYQVGPSVTELTTHDTVHTLIKAVRYLGNEAHLSLEFLRFSEYDGFLAAEITPNNNVILKIVPHFCDRYPDENFIIYDKNRKLAFLHKSTGETEFLHEAEITFPDAGEEETYYRALWKHFYNTIAVEGRINHKLRRTHMPMRYWPNMTEFNT